MKRRDLISKIAEEAKRQKVAWVPGEGGKHSAYRLGGMLIPIPRHNEIGEGLAREIFKQCEPGLGKDWWR